MKSSEQVGLTRIDREVKDGVLVSKKTTADDHILANNRAHRLARSRESGKRDLPFHPQGAKISYHFQAPPIPWQRFLRDHPDIAAGLRGKDQMQRELAAQAISRLHPEWVVTSPNMLRIA